MYAYTNAGGNNDIIKIEINYSLRSHIYESVNRPIVTQITGESFEVRTLDAVELFSAISAETINKEFRTGAIDEITINKIKRYLFPVSATKEHFDLDEKKISAKNFIRQLMCLTEQEKEFLERFEKKEYCPELLFSNEEILKRVENHPMARWKMLQEK